MWIPLSVGAPKIPLLQEGSLCITEGNTLCSGLNRAITWGLEKQLWEVTDKYGIDYDLFYDLAYCESRLRHDDVWGKAGEYGLFQWKLISWRNYCKKYDLDLNILNMNDQIELTARVLADGGEHNWKNCWAKIK